MIIVPCGAVCDDEQWGTYRAKDVAKSGPENSQSIIEVMRGLTSTSVIDIFLRVKVSGGEGTALSVEGRIK